MVDYYYCSLVFADLHSREKITLVHGEQFLKFTRETVQKKVNHLHIIFVDRDNVELNVVSVAFLFCTIPCRNNGTYIPWDKIKKWVHLRNAGRQNKDLFETIFPEGPADFQIP